MRAGRRNGGCAAIASVAATFAAFAVPAGAATLNVTTTADTVTVGSGCSLREAVINANTNSTVADPTCGGGEPAPATDVINLPDLDGPYELEIAGTGEDAAATGDLDVLGAGGPLEIRGQGQERTTVSGDDIDRVFHLQDAGSLTLVGMQVTGGRVQNGDGAGVRANGSLTLRGVAIASNDLTANTIATLRGAGVFVSGGPLVVEDSFVVSNTITPLNGSATGAGIAINDAAARIERTGLGANAISGVVTGQTGAGGGIGIFGTATGDLEVSDSLLFQNAVGGTTGTRQGGGISWVDDIANDDSLLVENSTITGNSVGGGQNGGGIYMDRGDNSIAFTTFGPTTPANMNGAGYYLDFPGGSVEVRGSLFATETDDDCNAGTSLGYNVELLTPGDDCQFNEPTDVLTDLPVIDNTIQEENGGPLPTHKVDPSVPDNPVIDAVPPGDCLGADGSTLGADQRGAPRPFDGGGAPGPQCDTGSYELNRCHGVVVNVIGTPGDDELSSAFGSGANVAEGGIGLGGDDEINLGNGADAVCAGDGEDSLTDTDAVPEVALDGEAGSDAFSGPGIGDDTINLAAGLATTPTGGDPDPIVRIENAEGGGGDDILVGDGGPNRLTGFRFGQTFTDVDDADTITGGGGADLLEGGPFSDQLFARDGEADVVDCGTQADTAQTDRLSLDSVIGCEGVDALAEPAVLLPTPPARPAAKKKCKKKKRVAGAAAKKCKKRKR